MRRRWTISVGIALGITAALTSPTDAGMLIGGSTDGTIYDVDQMTGLASNPRDTGLEPLVGLAFSPDGTLFAADQDSLYELHSGTGAPQVLGTLGQSVVKHDFGFDATTWMLFSSGTRPYQGAVYQVIYSIDPNTAIHTLVADGGGGSVAFDGGGQMFLHSALLDALFLINKENAEVVDTIALDTDLGEAGLSITEDGLPFIVDGGVSGTNSLYTIDLSNGAVTWVGHTGLANGLTSLTYIPEPATFALLFSGGLALHRRKRRKGLRGVAVAMAIVAGLTVPTQAGTLVAATGGFIYDVDPITGVASNPRDTGGFTHEIAFGNSSLYGESARSLYTIDVKTGEASLVGDLDGLEAYYSVQDLAWDPKTSSLFALVHVGGTTTDLLFTADTQTGAVTQIGMLDDAYTTMAFNSDGRLLALEGRNDVLAVVDKTTADTLSTIALGADVIPLGMTFDETDVLFFVDRVSDTTRVLSLLDPATGAVTQIGDTGLEHVLSLTYIPEPGSIVILGAGALAFYYNSRRRRRTLTPRGNPPVFRARTGPADVTGSELELRRRITRRMTMSIALAIGVLATVPTQAGTLVGASFGVIYDIDPLTGLASNPRDTGGASVRVGFGGGTLYGESARSLYTIDFETGTDELVGYLDGLEEYYSVQDLAWDPGTNSLFALVHVGGTSTDLLFTADTGTGAVTQIGVLDDAYTTMAFDTDGTLFALHGWDDALAIVDKTSAETLSSIAVQGGVIPAAMAFDDTRQLYVAARVEDDLSVLHTLDPYSGVLTPIGTTGLDLGLTSLTYIPEPATFALLFTGALALCYRTRRRSLRNLNHSCKDARGTGRCGTRSPNVSLPILLALLAFAGRVHGEGVGLGPNAIYTGKLHGDFQVTGTSIAESAWDAWADPDPFSGEFTLEIGIPSTADVVRAYLNWSYLRFIREFRDAENGSSGAGRMAL